MRTITRHDSSIQPDVTGEDLDQCAAHFECLHADTCLSDYWGGHHLPHVCFPVWPGMSLAEIKECLHSEINQGAIAGSFPVELACESNEYELSDKGYHEFHRAIDSIEGKDGKTDGFFSDIEETEEDEFSVFAFFVFRPV